MHGINSSLYNKGNNGFGFGFGIFKMNIHVNHSYSCKCRENHVLSSIVSIALATQRILSILLYLISFIENYKHVFKDLYVTIILSFSSPIFHSKTYEKLCSELFHIQKGFNERVLLLLLRALELNNAVNIWECTKWLEINC